MAELIRITAAAIAATAGVHSRRGIVAGHCLRRQNLDAATYPLFPHSPGVVTGCQTKKPIAHVPTGRLTREQAEPACSVWHS